MLSFMNYNFCADKNALDPMPTNAQGLTNLTIQNGIFDRLYLSKDLKYVNELFPPVDWDDKTIIDAEFQGDLTAGNVDFSINQLDHISIKRRKKGEFQWITLKEYKVEKAEDLNIKFLDRLNKNDTIYEYALVPSLRGEEGNYYTDEIFSRFDGIFICDLETGYKLYSGVDYTNFSRVQRVATLEPMGRKFPIVISNGAVNYTTGSVTGTILPPDYGSFDENGKINDVLDPIKMAKERDGLLDFLTNKKAKVLKDWAGNLWLVMITGTPAIVFKQGSGMGLADVVFDPVEIGDPENQDDLYETGIVRPREEEEGVG